jgi:cell division protein FtsB
MMPINNYISNIILVVLLSLITYQTIFGDKGLIHLNQLEEELNNIKKINNNHRLENKLLREEIDLLKYNNLYIEEKARKDLGLIKNKEIIYHIKKKNK